MGMPLQIFMLDLLERHECLEAILVVDNAATILWKKKSFMSCNSTHSHGHSNHSNSHSNHSTSRWEGCSESNATIASSNGTPLKELDTNAANSHTSRGTILANDPSCSATKNQICIPGSTATFGSTSDIQRNDGHNHKGTISIPAVVQTTVPSNAACGVPNLHAILPYPVRQLSFNSTASFDRRQDEEDSDAGDENILASDATVDGGKDKSQGVHLDCANCAMPPSCPKRLPSMDSEVGQSTMALAITKTGHNGAVAITTTTMPAFASPAGRKNFLLKKSNTSASNGQEQSPVTPTTIVLNSRRRLSKTLVDDSLCAKAPQYPMRMLSPAPVQLQEMMSQPGKVAESPRDVIWSPPTTANDGKSFTPNLGSSGDFKAPRGTYKPPLGIPSSHGHKHANKSVKPGPQQAAAVESGQGVADTNTSIDIILPPLPSLPCRLPMSPNLIVKKSPSSTPSTST